MCPGVISLTHVGMAILLAIYLYMTLWYLVVSSIFLPALPCGMIIYLAIHCAYLAVPCAYLAVPCAPCGTLRCLVRPAGRGQ